MSIHMLCSQRKWDADEEVDRQHWKRFAPFRPYETRFNGDGFDYDFQGERYIFMRWKGIPDG